MDCINSCISFYFVGIGGVSMSALAMLLFRRGKRVRGSDFAEGRYTRMLKEAGIPVTVGDEEEIFEDAVVYTGAIPDSHPQLAAARKAGKRLIARSELLGEIAKEYPQVLSVAGCHGKTTTSCMLAHIFRAANLPFTSHIGGEDETLGNFFSAGGETFITEACEFKRSFLALHSSVAVILSCDLDHTDCYRDEEDLFSAYLQFASQAKEVVVNADDVRARIIPHALSFGLYAGDVRAEKLSEDGERYAFTVVEGGNPVVRISLQAVGRVHVYNALAAYAASRLAGRTGEEIKRGLEQFRGVRRRFERVGTIGGVPVICDYAHHPREIAATLATAEKLCRGTVRVVFQPHTYTRTRDLMEEFCEVLGRAESPILYQTYSAREAFDPAGSAMMLTAHIKSARYVQSPRQLKRRLLEGLKGDDLVLVLGAGDIYDIACGIVEP